MAWIEYNGTRSTDLGVIVESMPDASRAERRVTVAEPIGRHGAITIDNGSYGDYSSSITINCFGKVNPAMIFRWLSGAGWLTTSDDPSKRRWVNFYKAQNAARDRYGAIYDSVSVPVVMDTFCHNISSTLITITNGMTIYGDGDYDADPILYVTGSGSGTITINGNTIYISGLKSNHTLKIDAEGKIYSLIDGTGSILNPLLNGVVVELEPDDDSKSRWFSLNNVGSNSIGITGLSAQIDPNWRWY